MDVRKLVGWNLRKLRVERGLTIEDLAGEAEAEPSYTARVERGTVNAGVDLLQRYAKALHIRVGELFAEVPAGSKPPLALPAGRRPGKSPKTRARTK